MLLASQAQAFSTPPRRQPSSCIVPQQIQHQRQQQRQHHQLQYQYPYQLQHQNNHQPQYHHRLHWSASRPNDPAVFPSSLAPYNDIITTSSSSSSSSSPPSSTSTTTTADNFYTFGADQPLFDFQDYSSSPSQSLMQSEPPSSSWLADGQLTPTSSRARHHRESSLSSLGSAGPASPYTANTANPQVAGDLYHELYDCHHPASKPLTPAHTPSQDQFLSPHYPAYYPGPNQLPFNMSADGLPKPMGDADLASARAGASHDSPSTPPSCENEDRRKNAYRSSMPKLDRTMTDIYADELYNPSFQITSAPAAPTPALASTLSPQDDVFTQRLQAANSQHLSASNTHAPLTMSAGERSPFRQGSPLAPSAESFGSQRSPNVRFGTATHMREQQKAENDARALQQQLERTSPEHTTPRTISPKDVDLVYHESEEDANMPLFPPQQPQQSPSAYRRRPASQHEPTEIDDTASQQSYGSMATTRRESSSAYSTSSHATQQQQQGNFNFAPPSVRGGLRQIPQQYPFVPQSRRQTSNVSSVTEEVPATLTSMESSSSEYAPEPSDNKKPAETSADSGTYTCTYHGCTLRFETPAKLQRHKREGHRNSAASMAAGGDEGGMTSAALRNTQNGPHKCERINPSTGKPCNTIFSRPYDLTRHEDTIHNARKQKVRCHLCTEEKTFSRNDALTRHFRVCHPDHVDFSKGRRRGVIT